MAESLRSIIEGMEHNDHEISDYRVIKHVPSRCFKCRLLAVLAEHEKVDLVKKWRGKIGVGTYATTSEANIQVARCQVLEQCADELAEWLAVKSAAHQG